jgi:hypothetical protein
MNELKQCTRTLLKSARLLDGLKAECGTTNEKDSQRFGGGSVVDLGRDWWADLQRLASVAVTAVK